MTAPVAEHTLTEALATAGLHPCRWPGVYRASQPVPTREQMDAITRATGATQWETHLREEEEGVLWWQVRATAGGVRLEIQADARPVLLDPLTDEGAIVRSWAAGDAL
jgi:hypothetical protein